MPSDHDALGAINPYTDHYTAQRRDEESVSIAIDRDLLCATMNYLIADRSAEEWPAT